MEGARIFAESAIRDKNTALNYLRLSSRIDAVAQRVNTAVKMQNLTKDMSGIVKRYEATANRSHRLDTYRAEQEHLLLSVLESGGRLRAD